MSKSLTPLLQCSTRSYTIMSATAKGKGNSLLAVQVFKVASERKEFASCTGRD